MNNIEREMHSKLSSRLYELQARSRNGDPSAKGLLSNLRDGGRRSPGDQAATWAEVVGIVPDELAGEGVPSEHELGVFHAVTLFALHLQGGKEAHHAGMPVGRALRVLITKRGSESMSSRVESLLGSATRTEFVRHLRSLVTLLRGQSLAMDYREIARAIEAWSHPQERTKVRMAWGREIYGYRTSSKTTKNKDNVAIDGDDVSGQEQDIESDQEHEEN